MSKTGPPSHVLDGAYDVFAHEYRRSTLSYLNGQQASATVEELAAHVAVDVEASTPPHDDELLERIGIELHHVHLPKLADEGFVDYDHGDTRSVTLLPRGVGLASDPPGWA